MKQLFTVNHNNIATNATSVSAVVFVNDATTTDTVNITNLDTGLYSLSVAPTATTYDVVVSVTVAGSTKKQTLNVDGETKKVIDKIYTSVQTQSF